jgi:hypothetical protein
LRRINLLLQGLRWGVGNGEKISITKDNWIPGFQAETFKPLSPIPSNSKVRYLMNDAGSGWEEDMIRAFFHEELAEVILQLPINKRGGDDFASWQYDKHGLYSVKSAYNLAKTADFFSKQETTGKGSGSDWVEMRSCGKQCG